MASGLNSRLIGILTCAFALVLISSQSAHAYLDPGTGSFILQSAIAGLLALGFIIKVKWRQLKNCFARLFAGRGRDAE